MNIKETREELTKDIEARLVPIFAGIDLIVNEINSRISSYDSDVIGLGLFVENDLPGLAAKLSTPILDKDQMIKLLATHCYLREVQLRRHGYSKNGTVSSVAKEPSDDFKSIARRCIAALHNIPEAGHTITVAQEDEHLDSAMAMSQALKKFEQG